MSGATRRTGAGTPADTGRSTSTASTSTPGPTATWQTRPGDPNQVSVQPPTSATRTGADATARRPGTRSPLTWSPLDAAPSGRAAGATPCAPSGTGST